MDIKKIASKAIDYGAFKWNSVAKSGGLSGSVSIKGPKDKRFQFKFSVYNKKIKDKPKAYVKGFTDHENVGELIAGEIASSLSKGLGTEVASPEINFVKPNPNAKTKQEKRSVNIVSQYIPKFKDMEGFFRDYTGFPEQKKIRYLKIDFNLEQKNSKVQKKHKASKSGRKTVRTAILGGKDMEQQFKQGISDGVAMNALFGNVDVNAKGNLGMQINEVGKKNAAILDFGHGFNNLITKVTGAQKAFGSGGGLGHENGILDFLNREKVLGGSKSKLWRDYEGLIPSELFLESLNKISSEQDKVLEGMNAAKEKIIDLSKNMEDKSMLKASLQRLNQNVGQEKVEAQNIEELINRTMDNLSNFVTNRQEQMKEVAQIMDLQLKIDAHIKHNPGQNLPMNIIKQYQSIPKKGQGASPPITWIKSDAKEPAKVADLGTYFKERQAELSASKKKEKPVKRGGFVEKLGGARKRVTSWVKHIRDQKSSAKSKDEGRKK